MPVTVFNAGLQGPRDDMEDAESIILNLDGKIKNKAPVNFYAIYDGHGGKEVSKFLEQHFYKLFTNPKVTYPLTKQYATWACDKMQNLLKKNKIAYKAGSTCVAVIHFKHQGKECLNVINVGDSKCIMCKDLFGYQLSVEHKPDYPKELIRLKKGGHQITYDGYDFRISGLSVSRAFGDADCKGVIHHPDLKKFDITKTDKFLVIACDGLWDVLSPQKVTNFVLINCFEDDMKTKKKFNFNISEMLAEYALKKGSTDNVSVIVVFF